MLDKPRSYFIRTYGCQANQADSEKIAGMLETVGLKTAKKIEWADWVIINTCSVRQSAEDRVLGLVRNLTRSPKHQTQKPRYLIVTGCILYHPTADLARKLPKVDYFVRTNEWPRFLEKMFDVRCSMFDVTPIRKNGVHAWVPIMEGCSHFCTYCVVPYARGKEKSRPFKEITCEVEKLVRQGYKYITLLGQNVNSYGKDIFPNSKQILNLKSQNFKKFKTPFALLLAVLNKIPGIEKISFVTSNPWDLTDDTIEAMNLPKIDHCLHLPAQSGDDEILRRMNRPYTALQYIKLVKKIRKKNPDIKISTDLIVGFPGENRKAFENTFKLCQRLGFDKAYIAIYSPRPGTAAFKLKDNVSYQEKKRRWKILEDLVN